MKLIIVCITLIIPSWVIGQIDKKDIIDSLYIGGHAAYITDFYGQVNYPLEIRPENIVGRVYFQAVIDTNGYISKSTIIKGIDERLDSILINTFKNTNGMWKTAQDSLGKKIEFKFTDSVYFERR